MLKRQVFNIILLILVSQAFTEDLKALDACYENSPRFYLPHVSLETLENIKTELIHDHHTKKLLLENYVEKEKAQSKLVKCVEELMKQNQFKVLEKFVEEVLDPLDFGTFPMISF